MDIIAFYLRLSLADGDLGKNNKDESNSIENQRLLLQSFVESMDELDGEIKEYIDDGYSGTNFNRPAFQEMIEDAKKGKIPYMFIIIPSRWDLSGTVGMAAMSVIIGAVFGFIVAIGIAVRAVWYVITFPVSVLIRKGRSKI